MGNAGNIHFNNQEAKDFIWSNYQFKKNLLHENILIADLWVSRSKDPETELVVKQKLIVEKEEAIKYKENIAKRYSIRNPNFAKAKFDEISKSKELCASYYQVKVCFDVFEDTLRSEADKRIESLAMSAPGELLYTESELWYILKTTISVLRSLEQLKIFHGNIKPQSIFVDHDKEIKIMDNLVVNFGETNYLNAFYNGMYRSCFCPLKLESLRTRDFKSPLLSEIKSDVFALGITILTICTGRKFVDYYNFTSLTVRMALLEDPEFLKFRRNVGINLDNPKFLVNSDLQKMRMIFGYSDTLVNYITRMLEPEEDSRPLPSELMKFLELNSEEVEDDYIECSTVKSQQTGDTSILTSNLSFTQQGRKVQQGILAKQSFQFALNKELVKFINRCLYHIHGSIEGGLLATILIVSRVKICRIRSQKINKFCECIIFPFTIIWATDSVYQIKPFNKCQKLYQNEDLGVSWILFLSIVALSRLLLDCYHLEPGVINYELESFVHLELGDFWKL